MADPQSLYTTTEAREYVIACFLGRARKVKPRGVYGSPGYVLSGALRDKDHNPSAYLKPFELQGPVWGDSGLDLPTRGADSLLAFLGCEPISQNGRVGSISIPPHKPVKPPKVEPPKPVKLASLRRRKNFRGLHLYHNAEGAPVLAVLRQSAGLDADGREKKKIKQLEPGPGAGINGDWFFHAPIMRAASSTPLYRLPELLDASPMAPVYLVEGETSVESLQAALDGADLSGIVTSTLGGADRDGAGARRADLTPLEGRAVFVLPDHDAPGIIHARALCELALEAGADDVRLVPVPGAVALDDVPESHGIDVRDYIEDGGAVADIVTAANAAPAFQLDVPDVPELALDPPIEMAPERRRFTLVPWHEMGAAGPPDWIIDKLVPAEGLTLLWAKPAEGKSLVALDWAARASHAGPVVYVAAEGARGFRARFRAWCELHNAEPTDNLVGIESSVNLTEPADVDELILAIGDIGRPPRLVILDTLARCAAGADENSARDAGLIIAACDRLQALGAAVILIHHPDKGGRGPRGSGAFVGAVDASIKVAKDGELHTVKSIKQKDGAELVTVVYRRHVIELAPGHTGAAVIETDERPAQPKPKPKPIPANRRAILEAVRDLIEADEPATKTAIAARAGVTPTTLDRQMGAALEAGQLEGDGGRGAAYSYGPSWPKSIPNTAIQYCPTGHAFTGASCEYCGQS